MNFPLSWEWTTIGSIVKFEYGKSLREDKRNSSGIFPVYGSNGIVGMHSEFLVKEPCLIVGRKGAAGKVHITRAPSWPIDTTYFVTPTSRTNLLFLYYLFTYLNLGSLDRSTAIPGLNREDAYAVGVPLPPLAEQECIVERIESLFSQLDAGVAALKRAQAGLKRYKAAVLKAACEGRLVLQDPNDEPAEEMLKGIHPGGAALAPTDLPELPQGWCWARVDQLCDVKTGATPLRSNTKYYMDGHIPWVTSGSLNDLYVDEPDGLITDLAIKETNAKIIPSGALLVAMYGEGKTRGKVSELRIEAAINQAIAALVFPKNTSVLKPYVKVFFQKNYDEIRLLSSGGVQPNLNLSIIKNTFVPIPPIHEQQLIVSEVERRTTLIDELHNSTEIALSRAARLRQSILKLAFEGRLVEQTGEVEEQIADIAASTDYQQQRLI